MRILKYLLLVAVLSSCSSTYEPNENVVKLKESLSVDDAISLLQEKIWPDNKVELVCGASGFWYDESSDMIIGHEGISMLSHKRGKILRQYNQKQIGEVVVFEKEYYKYNFEFAKLKAINIYKDYRLLPTFPSCNKKDAKQVYVIVDLYMSKENNLKFVVYQDSFDQLMAALLRVFDKVPVYIK